MAEDFSKMKAKKTSKTDSLNKIINSVGSTINDNSKSKSSSSNKSSSNKNQKNSTTQKSNTSTKTTTQKNNTTNKNTSNTQIKRKRGRPRKNQSLEQPTVSNIKNANKIDKTIKKSFKKQGLCLILFIAFLILGGCGGYAFSKFVVFNVIYPNDIYEMVSYTQGDKTSYDVYIKQNVESDEEFTYPTYTELGVKCISFGKDYSSDYSVKYYYRSDLSNKEVEVDKIDTRKEGIYYAVYSVKPAKYKHVKLIRNIFVLRSEDND